MWGEAMDVISLAGETFFLLCQKKVLILHSQKIVGNNSINITLWRKYSTV